MQAEAKAKTKRVKLKRAILLEGDHAEVGEVHELPVELANWLIAQDAAERSVGLRLSDLAHRLLEKFRSKKPNGREATP